MNKQETVRLLRECNAGIKMGVDSLNDVIPRVKNTAFADILAQSRRSHEALGQQTHALLCRYHDPDKKTNPIAKSMAHMKTSVKLAFDPTDAAVADLMTDGCHMGIKSLCRYLNQYPCAAQEVRNLTEQVVKLEEETVENIKPYL